METCQTIDLSRVGGQEPAHVAMTRPYQGRTYPLSAWGPLVCVLALPSVAPRRQFEMDLQGRFRTLYAQLCSQWGIDDARGPMRCP